MTLNLLKRSEKVSALTATEHDTNLTDIENEVNNKLDATADSVTNAREWTAATVTQAEAEAGTDTARKAWTVVRVWQAIAAWWAASAMKTKLDGIAAGATANSSDATLLNRSNHTGTQAFSTLTMATARLLGRSTAGSGAAEEIAIGSGLTLSAGTLSASGGGLPTGVSSPGDGALDFATGTLTASRPSLNVSQTWNADAVAFTGWRLNITDTASAAGSMLIDLQLGGASRFRVDKSGGIYFGTSSSANLSMSGTLLILRDQYGNVSGSIDTYFWSCPYELRVGSGYGFSTSLWADASNVLAQRRTTNAQEYRLYGTFTDASNYRRLSKGMSTAGVAFLRPEGAGTGASGNVLHISGLPTSNPGPGILWDDAGTVKVGT